MSSQASAAGQHQEAITLAEAARRGAGPGTTPRAAVILALASADPDTPEPGWAHWLDHPMAAAQTGAASLHLHDWEQARRHLPIALRTLDPTGGNAPSFTPASASPSQGKATPSPPASTDPEQPAPRPGLRPLPELPARP